MTRFKSKGSDLISESFYRDLIIAFLISNLPTINFSHDENNFPFHVRKFLRFSCLLNEHD